MYKTYITVSFLRRVSRNMLKFVDFFLSLLDIASWEQAKLRFSLGRNAEYCTSPRQSELEDRGPQISADKLNLFQIIPITFFQILGYFFEVSVDS